MKKILYTFPLWVFTSQTIASNFDFDLEAALAASHQAVEDTTEEELELARALQESLRLSEESIVTKEDRYQYLFEKISDQSASFEEQLEFYNLEATLTGELETTPYPLPSPPTHKMIDMALTHSQTRDLLLNMTRFLPSFDSHIFDEMLLESPEHVWQDFIDEIKTEYDFDRDFAKAHEWAKNYCKKQHVDQGVFLSLFKSLWMDLLTPKRAETFTSTLKNLRKCYEDRKEIFDETYLHFEVDFMDRIPLCIQIYDSGMLPDLQILSPLINDFTGEVHQLVMQARSPEKLLAKYGVRLIDAAPSFSEDESWQERGFSDDF